MKLAQPSNEVTWEASHHRFSLQVVASKGDAKRRHEGSVVNPNFAHDEPVQHGVEPRDIGVVGVRVGRKIVNLTGVGERVVQLDVVRGKQ
jgi:hypothetical protein